MRRALAVLLSALLASPLQAAPGRLNFQSSLKDANGNPLTGATTLTFAIVDGTGATLWSEAQTVTPVNGVVSLKLGSVNAIAPSVLNGDDRRLRISVDGLSLGEEALVSAPFALKASDADALGGAAAASYVTRQANGFVGLGGVTPDAPLDVLAPLDGGIIRLRYPGHAAVGEIGMINGKVAERDLSTLWIGSNLDSNTGDHSGPRQSDVRGPSLYSEWHNGNDAYYLRRLAPGGTTASTLFSVSNSGAATFAGSVSSAGDASVGGTLTVAGPAKAAPGLGVQLNTVNEGVYASGNNAYLFANLGHLNLNGSLFALPAKVGVGTPNPAAVLQVNGPGGALHTLADFRDGAAASRFFLRSDGHAGIASGLNIGYGDASQVQNNPSGGLIVSGSVGIGNTNPSKPLDVTGDAKATRLCIGSDCRSSWPGDPGYFRQAVAGAVSSDLNLGLGTDAPQAPFEIQREPSPGSGVAVMMKLDNAFQVGSSFAQPAAGDGQAIEFHNGYASSTPRAGIELRYFTGEAGKSSLVFRTKSNSTYNEALTLDPSGNAGIGTTAPLARLHIRGTPPSIRIDNAGAASSTAGTIGSDGTGNLYLLSSADLDSNSNSVARQTASASIGLGRHDTAALTFNTSQGLTVGSVFAPNERMRINGLGDVGIGTNAPSARLHVQKTGTGEDQLRVSNPNTTETAAIQIANGGRVQARFMGFGQSYGTSTRANDLEIANLSAGEIVFQTDNVVGSGTTRMTIHNGGTIHINQLGTGTVYSNAGNLTNSQPSSRDYKDGIEPASLHAERLLRLEPRSWTWKSDGKADVGFIAEELREVLPELYREDATTKGYDAAKLPIYTIELLKAQQKELERLREELETLKRRIEAR